MIKFWMLTCFTGAALLGCIHNPVPDLHAKQAMVRSSYPILSVDGAQPVNRYRLQIPAGNHTMAVQFRTLSRTYICHFEWHAQQSLVYEVVRDRQKEPLTLYVWTRENPLWASRTHPVAPIKCSGPAADKQ